ncbi:MAG: transposase family protein [Actinophytocola sp.]|uniref:transposase family protein n=1 Tax=Actinophytocola sp. TaxID=1872138 RepID=UPI003D6ADABA
MPDPRCRRGVRHSVMSVLGFAAAAVAAGVSIVTGIGEWAADAPRSVLRRMGVRLDRRRQLSLTLSRGVPVPVYRSRGTGRSTLGLLWTTSAVVDN